MEEMKTWEKIIITILLWIQIIAILFVIFLVEVNAEQRIQTIPLGYSGEDTTQTRVIYNSTNANFANWGRGYLTFNFAVWKGNLNQVDFQSQLVQDVQVISSGNIYICELGSVVSNFNLGENYKIAFYSAVCDVTMGNLGLQQIKVNLINSTNNNVQVKTSEYMTFSDNLQIDTTNTINTALTQIQTLINTITTNQTNYTQSINTTITTVVNTNFNALLQAIANNNQAIINNQNEIAEQQEEQQKVCNKTTITKNDIEYDNNYLKSDGTLNQNNMQGVTRYIKLSYVKSIKNTITPSNTANNNLCFYDNNKIVINCLPKSEYNNQTLTIPNNAEYVRFTIIKSTDTPQFEIETCQNGNQAIVDYGEDVEPDSPPEYATETEEAEEALLEDIEEIEMPELEIDLDQNANEWVWDRLTDIISVNASVFGMFISILVLGIIKTIMGR